MPAKLGASIQASAPRRVCGATVYSPRTQQRREDQEFMWLHGESGAKVGYQVKTLSQVDRQTDDYRQVDGQIIDRQAGRLQIDYMQVGRQVD